MRSRDSRYALSCLRTFGAVAKSFVPLNSQSSPHRPRLSCRHPKSGSCTIRASLSTGRGTAFAPSKFNHAALCDRAWKYDVDAAEELEAICAKNGWPLWDMFTPAYDWLFKTGLPSEFYSRDYVHSGELGKQLIGRIAIAYFAAANWLGTGTPSKTRLD